MIIDGMMVGESNYNYSRHEAVHFEDLYGFRCNGDNCIMD